MKQTDTVNENIRRGTKLIAFKDFLGAGATDVRRLRTPHTLNDYNLSS